jgi:CRISPR/Cas system-associated exonuclease Cas4 (RecB family)
MYCRNLHNAIVIYEWKPTQEFKEFHLSYDHALVQPMLDGAKLVLGAIEEGIAPSRPQGYRKSVECRFCPFKEHCWNGK